MPICVKCGKSVQSCKRLCSTCYYRDYMKGYYKDHKKEIKKRSFDDYHNNIEERRAQHRLYSKKNYNKLKQYYKDWYKKHREDRVKKCKDYYKKNRDKVIQKQYENRKHRLKTDPQYYIKDRLSTRIRMAIMNQTGKKTKRTIELLGVDIEIVRRHIESQWLPGMSWENHNIIGWHIDHIRPCASFDLTDPEQQKECFNYKNLQPLWGPDNLKKGAKYDVC